MVGEDADRHLEDVGHDLHPDQAFGAAIAGAQAAVYPWASPGGWHLLGRTPVRLFDLADAARPALLAPGDTLRFAPVGRDEFECLAADVAAGKAGRKEWQVA